MSNDSVRVEVQNSNMLRVYTISGLKVTSGFDKSLTILLNEFDRLLKLQNKKGGINQ